MPESDPKQHIADFENWTVDGVAHWVDHMQERPEYHCTGFENGTGVETTTHRRLVGNWGLNPTGWIPNETKISTFSIGFKRDSESYNVIFRMSMIQSKLN